MRTKFFAIAALVLGMASCQKDFAPEVNLGGEVDFQIAVSAPELSKTRAGVDGAVDANNAMDSAFGAIDYLDGAFDGVNHDRVDWNDVDLRYSLEVYDADALSAKPIKDRIVIIKDKYEAVTFDLRLIPNRNYQFVVFADFVAQGASVNADQTELGLRHNINGTLQNITIKEDKLNDEAADAYFKSWDFTPTSNTHNRTEATLTRPYAKVRVVATDLAELNLNLDPASVEVYYTATHPAQFNAVTGAIEEVREIETVYDYTYAEGVSKMDLSNHTYTAYYDDKAQFGYDPIIGERRHSHMTLFTDYILATDSQNAVSFKMIVKDELGATIKVTDINTTIPIQRNHLTTVIGNVLTSGVDVEITINDNFASQDVTNASSERRLLETLINGGKFVLTEDLTLTAPHFLQGIVDENGVVCRADAVIDLNGYTLKYEIPYDVADDVANKYAIFVRVLNNASLTFIGEGQVISDGYIASVNEGGVLNISEGTFETNSCTVFQSNGGEINIAGGEFKAAEYNGDHRYTINFIDSKKQEGLIEITGGRFYKYNPSESNSENPAMDFCGAGYWGVQDGDWYEVVAKKDIDLFVDHAEVYTAEGLIQWAYIVENGATAALRDLDGFDENTFDKNAYGLKVMANIKLPARAFAVDAAAETYVYTDEVITVENGIPSASNWPAISDYETANQVFFGANIEGNNHTISGLRMNYNMVAVGFICWTKDSVIKDLTFADAVVYNQGSNLSESYTGIVTGRAWDGSVIYNVHIKNSSVLSARGEVGGIAGRLYRRTVKSDGTIFNEELAYIVYCSTDKNTTVEGTQYIGGIVGKNYGAIMGHCVNNASVKGKQDVGGVVGRLRAYTTDADCYVINCHSTAEATVTATTKNAGGVVGSLFKDKNHLRTVSWLIACSSESTISAPQYRGAVVGTATTTATVTSCWGLKNGATKVVGTGTPTINAAYAYDAATDATQEQVDAMNAAIEAFNVSENNPQRLEIVKRWVLTANGPVLQ